MSLSRRQFLGASAAAGAAAAAAAALPAPPVAAIDVVGNGAPPALPPIEAIALNRMAYGPRPGDLARVRSMGLAAYVNEQLNPNDADDALFQQKLSAATLRIQYGSTVEDRPLTALSKSLDQLWPLGDFGIPNEWAERVRPADEVRVETWLRAVYSKWQLREVLAEFWHNHFNVMAYSDARIAATWPFYDRAVIRQHCLGNFRAFLGAVARSIAMQYYLDNVSSKDGPANENYARELFELHTLGSGNYFNSLYSRWREVPGALDGKPVGYIDQDVYEAARAFTGWTIENGAWNGRGGNLPNTGNFTYYDPWHDNAQKRVLAVEFDPNRAQMADGEQVLDLLAFHPGTARHLCTKLCRRLVADNPPASLIDKAVATWTAKQRAGDQIKETVRTILLAPEFAAIWGQKVKRPFEQIASFLRATDASFMPNGNFFWRTEQTGYRLFSWPTPTGHPDNAAYWLGTNVMLNRWNLIFEMQANWLTVATFDLPGQTPAGATCRQIVDFWIARLLGRAVSPEIHTDLLDFMRQKNDPNTVSGPDAAPRGNDVPDRINNLVTLICMLPDFQWR